MNINSQYLRQSFFIIMFFMALLLCLVYMTFYFGMDQLFSNITIAGKMHDGPKELIEKIDRITTLQANLRMYFYPVSAAVLALTGLMLWFFLKIIFLNNFKNMQFSEKVSLISSDSDL